MGHHILPAQDQQLKLGYFGAAVTGIKPKLLREVHLTITVTDCVLWAYLKIQ